MQEIFHEHSTHLRFLNEHLNANTLLSTPILDRICQQMLRSFRDGSRHAPYFIYGPHGSGKSSLIAELNKNIKCCFSKNHPNIRVSRIIRFAAATPRSAYNLELLRVICQQISIIYDIPEGYLPKDASFDPNYIYNWFQNLLKRIEDFNNEYLILFIDDLHKLNPLDCDVVASLSWLPISLPWNVHIVSTTGITIEQIKFTQMQKDRFKSKEYYYDMTLEENRTILKQFEVDDGKMTVASTATTPFENVIIEKFNRMEMTYGKICFGRLASLITCSEYGLSETELLELLMPTDDPDKLIESANGNFNFSSFAQVRNEMGKFFLFVIILFSILM